MTESEQRDDLGRTAHVEASPSLRLVETTGPVAGARARFWETLPGEPGPWRLELAWDAPVPAREVVVRQHVLHLHAFAVSTRDAASGAWSGSETLDAGERRLPAVVPCAVTAGPIDAVRVEGRTGPVSIAAVEVFAAAMPPATVLAGDANGRFIGMVCDGWGYAPVAGARVTISGRGAAGPWKTRCTSGGDGLFAAPMPLGLTGVLRIVTETADGSARTRWKAEDLPYGLTPLSHGERVETLDDGWRFAVDPPSGFQEPGFDDRGWSPIHVPAHVVMEGFDAPDGIGGYRRNFTVAEKRRRLKLRFDGVYSGAEVWVNGIRVAYHEGGALPFEADITRAVKPGANLLAVRVTEHTVTSDRLDRMSFYADFPLAGIMRTVRLVSRPVCHLGALALETVFDERYENATLATTVAVLNEADAPAAAALSFRLVDPRGRVVPVADVTIELPAGPWERVERSVSIAVPRPLPWDAEHPDLYTLELRLSVDGRLVQRLAQRVGFRQTEIRGSEILVNGAAVKIRGTCHHDTHPLMGRAVSPAHERRDARMIKDANLNSLRTSHYPPLPELLEAADEIGLYVEDEGSFCWADGNDDLRLSPRIMQMNAELLARDRNHPSVFMWSVCNESSFGLGFRNSHRWVRRADPRRPTAAATGADLEIATLHNPISVARIRDREGSAAPLLFDEAWCVWQGIFGDIGEMWLDPGIRDYYGEPLPAVYEAMMASRVTQGSQIWCWADDLFCVPGRGLEYGRGTTKCHFVEGSYLLPGRGICGDAPWGVVDGWQRPKPEYWIVRKLFSPVRVTESVLKPGPDGRLRIPVRNDFDHTDLSEVSFRWSIGAERGSVRVAARPRAETTIVLRPRRKPAAGSELRLEARSAGGRLVDAWRFPIGEERTEPRPTAVVPSAVRIVEESTLATRSVRIANAAFDIAFAIREPAYYDHGGGHLRRCAAFGQPLLLEAPQVHLLPTRPPRRPLPDRSAWQVRELQSERRGRGAGVRIAGTYGPVDAAYEWTIGPTGEIEVSAHATWNGDDTLAREVGLAFSVPLDCDVLRWSRRAEWRVYPGDHIGRPRGRARAHIAHPAGRPPSWPWAEDDSAMGTNDFRSTKRNVHWAAIGAGAGPGVLIRSDGRQHVRATVLADRIAVHVLDWYGGTNAGLPEWYLNYGEGRLVRRGETIASTVRLALVPDIDRV